MKLVLSFDDGRADNIRVHDEILVPMGIPATYNIATAYVDGTISDEKRPCPNAAMTVEDVKRLAKSPLIELAGHGDQHQNTPEDLAEGLRKLRSWIAGDASKTLGDSQGSMPGDGTGDDDARIIGIASPNSILTAPEVISMKQTYEEMDVEYVRIGPGETYSGIRRIAGKLSRMTGSKGAFLKAYDRFDEHLKGAFVMRSVPVMHTNTLDQVKSLTGSFKAKGSDLILMFHSILKPGEDYYEDDWSWDYDSFRALLEWLKGQEGIEIVTTRQAFRGRQE